ncbi:MAG: protein translocase subunit SecD [Myxococcota bacterium]|nr:protein translocase subunit SecD [Myxococcota bacterium]
MSGLTWRAGSILALVLIFAYVSAANFIPKEERQKSSLWPEEGIRLGLDLQGGIHWVVGVKIDEAVQHELEFLRDNMREVLTDQGVQVESIVVENGLMRLQGFGPENLEAVRSAATDMGSLERDPGSAGLEVYRLTADWNQEIRERTMAQVLEVLRRRIDDPVRGIPDSVVTRQGDDRVLVQIPGGQIDRGRARELLKSTGFLEFKIVLDSAGSEELLLARYPGGITEEQEISVERDPETDQVVAAYLMREAPDITGDYLADARLSWDNQQRPLVSFRFNPEGGRIFGKLTEENVGNQLAIILDENVYSAPVIRSRISTNGQIEGRYTVQQAADLAVVLRAGALSVPVVIEEERSVGPALGQDSIVSGTRASMVGLTMILLFAAFYYRLSGLYASMALIFNLVLLMGVMSLFEATLTLPGIAGLVLTVGMAIDANVIIFERIREELRGGKTPRSAVATGFSKATWTVLDANITTLITALILFEFGTGPIKGFAVTLSVGILTSVFAALVVTRTFFMLYPGGRSVPQLSI